MFSKEEIDLQLVEDGEWLVLLATDGTVLFTTRNPHRIEEQLEIFNDGLDFGVRAGHKAMQVRFREMLSL